MPEFDLIRRLQEIIRLPAASRTGCILGIGDDAAVLELPADRQLVVCTDTLVCGTHFPENTDPAAIGHKALAVNLSDLAAMGAEPAWFFMALTLPSGDTQWLEAFARGMGALAARSGCALAGGDLTSGHLSVTVTALGLIEPGAALTRAGAKEGHLVFVSGEPGAAAHALGRLDGDRRLTAAERRALDYPEPRLELGRALTGLASSCIDLSDGLAADLGHILEQSGVGAELELERLPVPPQLSSLEPAQRWDLQLAGGDDYELCFTIPPSLRSRLQEQLADLAIGCTEIGRITAAPGLLLRKADGSSHRLSQAGYEHFSGGGS